MNIQHIETADCNILDTKIFSNEIKIYFDSVYDLEKKQYISNISLTVFNWSFFEAKVFIVNDLNNSFVQKKLFGHELEFFEYIQKISIESNNLILQGYSKESGYWLEYCFIDSDFYLEPF
ncbi:hypothetical protein GQ597_04655 [Gilliamella sp. Pra-s65]|uniref:hypothetical protein n=1 Tax=unclassified Gilliamella TaxID=2685620 RepID=UPI001365CD83|nr:MULTISPECIES: hypothetical protein [unclassified Gilliamella]MWN89998.1 hypothetical protein [Gilliamella sp. Pra-s65]MWP72876.1 hypothetical protein [Gilliamella sp. Pra-s52]